MTNATPKPIRLHDWIANYVVGHHNRMPDFVDLHKAGFQSIRFPHNNTLGQSITNWCEANLCKDDYILIPFLQFKVIAFDYPDHIVTIKLMFSEEFTKTMVIHAA